MPMKRIAMMMMTTSEGWELSSDILGPVRG
jgi:hypothetical protein